MQTFCHEIINIAMGSLKNNCNIIIIEFIQKKKFAYLIRAVVYLALQLKRLQQLSQIDLRLKN